MAKPGEPDFEDRKLQYLNAQARLGALTGDKQLKALRELDQKYRDVVEELTPRAPERKKILTPKGEASIEDVIGSFGALSVALAVLPHLTDAEFDEFGQAAAKHFDERNPNLQETAERVEALATAIGVPVRIEGGMNTDVDLHFVAEEAGAYEQKDGSGFAKFAPGDKLFMSESGVMHVVSSIPADYATMKIAALTALGLQLGMPKDTKAKADVLAWFELAVNERQAVIDEVPDPSDDEEEDGE